MACLVFATALAAHIAPPPAARDIGDGRLPVGAGMLALYASHDWNVAQPSVTRAVVIVHGLNRNAADYFATAQTALRLSGGDPRANLLIAPQFLAAADIAADNLLRWGWNHWADGSNAEAPAPVSSFAALDAVLRRLADRRLLPSLSMVVVAGFSAGGQLVQRYAVVGEEGRALERDGVHVRYVVGSPSSYLYFSADRPEPTTSCVGFNNWRYGLTGGLPSYVGALPDRTGLERAYVARDVVYLLGGADTNPNHSQLDRSCAGEAEGATRLARGLAYFAYLRGRDGGDLKQRSWLIPNVGHNERRIFTSPCGVAALFDAPGCDQR